MWFQVEITKDQPASLYTPWRVLKPAKRNHALGAGHNIIITGTEAATKAATAATSSGYVTFPAVVSAVQSEYGSLLSPSVCSPLQHLYSCLQVFLALPSSEDRS